MLYQVTLRDIYNHSVVSDNGSHLPCCHRTVLCSAPILLWFFSSVFRTLSCSLWANRRDVGMPWVKSIVFTYFLTSVCLPQCTLTSSFNVLSILILLTSLLSSLSSTIYSESCWEVNEPVYEVTKNNFLALSIYEFYLLFHLPIPPAPGLELISLGLLPFVCSHSC